MQGRLILVHLMCHDMAPFQAENVDEDKATGKKRYFAFSFSLAHRYIMVHLMLAQNQLE